MSAILAYAVNFIPGLHLRASEEAELLGMDDDQLGEFAYDYVEVRRDYLAWTPSSKEQNGVDPEMPQEHRHGIAEHSAMLKKDEVSSSSDHSSAGGIPAAGDRHAVAAEDEKREETLQGHPELR